MGTHTRTHNRMESHLPRAGEQELTLQQKPDVPQQGGLDTREPLSFLNGLSIKSINSTTIVTFQNS